MSLLLILSFWAGPSAAQQAARPVSSPVSPQEQAVRDLQTASQGRAAQVMDGTLPRREGPYLIVEEERDVLVREFDARRRVCDAGDIPPNRGCYWEPAGHVKVYGTRQTVEIASRRQLENERANLGGLIGMGVGTGAGALLGLILLAAGVMGPVGILGLAAIGLVAGGLLGMFGGWLSAEMTPDRFERVVDERREVS